MTHPALNCQLAGTGFDCDIRVACLDQVVPHMAAFQRRTVKIHETHDEEMCVTGGIA
jgi:hypothetical protein